MLHMLGYTIGLSIALSNIEAERKHVQSVKDTMSPEKFAEWHSLRLKRKQQEAEEATKERRHQELCNAIRRRWF